MYASLSGKGCLFMVSGASGAGKDAIIDGARHRLAAESRVVFPLRTIARPEGFGGEVHVAVTPAQFDRLRRRGAFALYWGTRGLNYAIPASIDQDIARGCAVVVNAPPCVLPEARARYGEVVVVWVNADPALRRQRLLARGRDSLTEIEGQMGFADDLPPDDEVEVIVNEDTLDAAVDALVGLVMEWVTRERPAKRQDAPGLSVPGPL
jgi:ribose 1,5-bisphosphokinase